MRCVRRGNSLVVFRSSLCSPAPPSKFRVQTIRGLQYPSESRLSDVERVCDQRRLHSTVELDVPFDEPCALSRSGFGCEASYRRETDISSSLPVNNLIFVNNRSHRSETRNISRVRGEGFGTHRPMSPRSFDSLKLNTVPLALPGSLPHIINSTLVIISIIYIS